MKTNLQTMMMINKYSGPLVLLLFFLLPEPCQSQANDLRARVGLSIQKDFNKKLSAGLEYEHRFDNLLTTFDKALIEPSVSYNLTKFLRFGLSYRLCFDQNRMRETRFEQRASIYARFDKRIDDFRIKVRTALQYGSDDLTNAVFSYAHKLVNRNAVELEYDWFGLPITPFAGFEFFYYINDPNGGIINQTRLKTGIDYKLNRSSTFSFYYMFEDEFNIANPTDSHIFGVGYRFRF